MSREYKIEIGIESFKPQRAYKIALAIQEEFSIMFNIINNDLLHGRGIVCIDEPEREFITRLAKAVWQANMGYCIVEISMVYSKDCIHSVIEHMEWMNN